MTSVAPRPSPQTERLVALLEMIAAQPERGVSLAEVTRGLGVHKASCHSMLSSLVQAGWLLRDPTSKAYTLGPALMRLGTAAASRFPALDVARPAMAELAARTGGHVIAFQVDSDHVTVVHQVRNLRVPATPMRLGLELPTRPPYGAALMAFSGDDERARWLSELPDDARRRYGRALNATRRRGFAVGLHVLPDIRLQELASLIRAAETGRRAAGNRAAGNRAAGNRQGSRLTDLADALTEELIHREEWFLSSITASRQYDVSHIDSPVFGADGKAALMLSLVPVPSLQSGAQVMGLGERLLSVTRRLSEALGGGSRPGPLNGETASPEGARSG